MSEVGLLYLQLRTFHQRCLLITRLLPLYPQLRTWEAPPGNVSVCEGLSDACRDWTSAANSVGRRRTSLRGGNRGPGWTGWCRRLWGFDGLAFGVDGGEVGAISVIWALGASTRCLFGLATAFEGHWRAPWVRWRGLEQSGAVADGKDGVL